MKYTIELTNKQKAQMDCIIEIVHRYIGFNPKLEPIKATNVEDKNEYQIGYKTGYDIAQTNAQATKKEWGKAEYDRGYNVAINDYNAMIQWLHDCKDDFKRFMNVKCGYDIMYLTNPKVDEGVMLYDLICDHDMAEVISEFKKWQEEKKKAEEESIKVGDEVIFGSSKLLVTEITNASICTVNADGKVDTWRTTAELIKTGRHFDEVEQLLDKLRGSENEENN